MLRHHSGRCLYLTYRNAKPRKPTRRQVGALQKSVGVFDSWSGRRLFLYQLVLGAWWSLGTTLSPHSLQTCSVLMIPERKLSVRRYFSFWLICFLTHQVAINLFRCIGAIGRSLVVAYTVAWLIFLLLILLSGRP